MLSCFCLGICLCETKVIRKLTAYSSDVCMSVREALWVCFLHRNVSGKCNTNVSNVLLVDEGRNAKEKLEVLQE